MIRKTCINLISIISAAFWIVIFSAVIILPVDLSAQTSICFSIESESEQYLSDGTFDSGSSDLELGNDNTTPQIVGLRYTAVNIPSGAVVSNATIQFTADETSSGASNIDIAGELISNSTSFNENQVNNLSSRTLTNSTVNWIPFQWIAGVSGSRQKTPDLSPIINEILNTTGFN